MTWGKIVMTEMNNQVMDALVNVSLNLVLNVLIIQAPALFVGTQ